MLASTYQIHKANEADLSIIHDLAQRIWKKTYESFISSEQIDFMFDLMYSMEGLRTQLVDSNHQFYIIFKAHIPVGFASVSLVSNSMYRIHKIYILPEVQGQNAGSSLLDFIDDLARENGVLALELNVNRYNQKAISFYQKVGFVITETVDIPLAAFVLNDYVMQRQVKK